MGGDSVADARRIGPESAMESPSYRRNWIERIYNSGR
jgi:hypothetical protein